VVTSVPWDRTWQKVDRRLPRPALFSKVLYGAVGVATIVCIFCRTRLQISQRKLRSDEPVAMQTAKAWYHIITQMSKSEKKKTKPWSKAQFLDWLSYHIRKLRFRPSVDSHPVWPAVQRSTKKGSLRRVMGCDLSPGNALRRDTI
jgi:hypothetical protein